MAAKLTRRSKEWALLVITFFLIWELVTDRTQINSTTGSNGLIKRGDLLDQTALVDASVANLTSNPTQSEATAAAAAAAVAIPALLTPRDMTQDYIPVVTDSPAAAAAAPPPEEGAAPVVAIPSLESSDNKDEEPFNFLFNRSKFPLPDWLETFLQSQPIATHNASLADPNQKFIVMTCHKYEKNKDEACGGFSDRMKLLPYYLWLAKESNRMLLIMYTKPHPLEEYLVPPPVDGFDWRANGFLDQELEEYGNRPAWEYKRQRWYSWHGPIFTSPWNNTRVVFANTNLAIPSIEHKMLSLTGMKPEDVKGGIWRWMFHPSPALAKIITATAKEHGLVPGQYAGAHLRAKFPVAAQRDIYLNKRNVDKEGGGLWMDSERTRYYVQEISHNAMNCAMKIMPETKLIYFASDANEPVEFIVRDSVWGKPNNTTNSTSRASLAKAAMPNKPNAVSRLDYDKEPVHFDKDGKRSSNPADLYPTFVDLWFLAHAKCMSEDIGGYSLFAAQLTGNFHTCRILHRGYGDTGLIPCPMFLKNTTGVF